MSIFSGLWESNAPGITKTLFVRTGLQKGQHEASRTPQQDTPNWQESSENQPFRSMGIVQRAEGNLRNTCSGKSKPLLCLSHAHSCPQLSTAYAKMLCLARQGHAPHAPRMTQKTDGATVDDSLKLLSGFHSVTRDPAVPLLGAHPRQRNTCPHKDLNTRHSTGHCK